MNNASSDVKTFLKRSFSGKTISQMYYAKRNHITEEMKYVAEIENEDPEVIRQEIALGKLIIPSNINHTSLKPMGVGKKVSIKINANIGNSAVTSDIDNELHKLNLAVKFGADTVMDLSTGGDLNKIREAIIKASPVPVGTVPIYQVVTEVKKIEDITPELLLDIIELQAKQGVDYMTVHCGVLYEYLPLVKNRITGIVSRGGSILALWMTKHKKQNPLYEHYDKILEIARKYDVTLSLGDGLRPGCLADASDEAQFAELETLGELTQRAWEKDGQVMFEGPGHLPLDQIEMNVKKEQEICKEAPFYVLGPLVTDIAPGYDHITSAIGATMAGFHGASLLCYVTPKEHLGLPELEDVRQGVIAYRTAAHAADVARGEKKLKEQSENTSKARFEFDWDRQFELSLDPETARRIHDENLPHQAHKQAEVCSMCGPKFCSMHITREMNRFLEKQEQDELASKLEFGTK